MKNIKSKIVVVASFLLFALIAQRAFSITYSQLNRYVFASYTPSNFAGKVLYIFEDPLCPYCHELNEHIVKYSQESGYRINLIFKIVHGKPAFDYAVKFVCGHALTNNINENNLNFVEYISLDYIGNFCKSGERLVVSDEKIDEDLGVSITPSLLSNTGFKEEGLSLKDIKKGLGIEIEKKFN